MEAKLVFLLSPAMHAPIEHPKVVDAEPAATILFPAKACYVPAWGSVTWEPRGKGDTVARWAHKRERLRGGARVVSCVKLRVPQVCGGLGRKWEGWGRSRGEKRTELTKVLPSALWLQA